MSKLLAPNGKPSNLTPEQYKLVRTPAFKEWFGDWENHSKNSSKVVDKNGEPLVVYHGSRSRLKFAFSEFNVPNEGVYFSSDYTTATWFSSGYDYKLQFQEIELPNNLNENSSIEDLEKYFKKNIDPTAYTEINTFDDGTIMYRLNSYNESVSSPLGQNLKDAKARLFKEIQYEIESINNKSRYPFYNVFLNIRNPYKIDAKGNTFDETPFENGNYSAVSVTSEIKSRGKNDGVIIKNTIETTELNRKSNSYIVFNSNQIKLADGTNTTFDGNNPDIRFDRGGKTFNDKELLKKYNNGESIGFTAIAHLKSKGLIERADGTKRKSMSDGGLTKNKMDKKIKLSKEEMKDFNLWMQDGNVSKNPDGSYSTQDAQWRNNLKDLDALKEYYAKEFLSGGRYAGGGQAGKIIMLKNPYNKRGVFFEYYAKENISKIMNNVPFRKFGNEFRKHIDQYFLAENNTHRLTMGMSWSELASYIIGDGSYNLTEKQYNNFIEEFNTDYENSYAREDEYEDGGTTDDKHLMAKAIEFIIGTAIDSNSIEIEPTKILFKRKNSSVQSSLNKKLIEDTIRMHGKSLKGRYADGGDTNYFSKKLTNFSELKNHPLVESIEKEFNRNFNPNDEYDNEFNYILYLKEPYVFSADNKYWKSITKPSKGELFTAFNEMLPIIDESEAEYRASGEFEYAKGGEAGFDDSNTSSFYYHEKQGNFLVPKNEIYMWLYEGQGVDKKVQSGEYDYVFYPYSSMSMAWQKGFIPPLKKIWTKKFQKDHKGSEHLLGVIKAYLLKDGKELYIDMMSVNPNKKKKGIMSYMIKELRDIFNLTQDQVRFSDLTKEGEKFVGKKTYADGGDIPHEDKMFQLPLEMVVYVPSTQDVDKVISVDKMDKRVDEVKQYLASKFGGYTSSDKLGGYVDSTGNLVNEDVVQVTSFSTQEAYAENKEELIQQLAKWGKEWGQEAIGFEFEGDLMYVPQEL